MPESTPILVDISPPLSPGLAVFPGDTPLSREILLELERDDPVTLSSLRATVHLGAHLDAPSHYGNGAPTIDRLPLELFVGPCRVITVPAAPGDTVSWPAVRNALDRSPPTERLLLATGSYRDPTRFEAGFAGLEPEVVRQAARLGVRLLGVDTPSVDPADSKDLPAHAACLQAEIAILEGLVLTGVAPGEYELIALPLRLIGFEASPVRAVLRRV